MVTFIMNPLIGIHIAVSSEIVPAAFVFIPCIPDGIPGPVEPGPAACGVFIPVVFNTFSGVAQIEFPASVFFLPSGFVTIVIILNKTFDADESLSPATRSKRSVSGFTVAVHYFIGGRSAAVAADDPGSAGIFVMNHFYMANSSGAGGIGAGEEKKIAGAKD